MPPFGVLHIVADVMDTAPLFLATSTHVDRLVKIGPDADYDRESTDETRTGCFPGFAGIGSLELP